MVSRLCRFALMPEVKIVTLDKQIRTNSQKRKKIENFESMGEIKCVVNEQFVKWDASSR